MITERRVLELIPVLGSQPAADVSHKPDGRLPLLSARPAATPATLTHCSDFGDSHDPAARAPAVATLLGWSTTRTGGGRQISTR